MLNPGLKQDVEIEINKAEPKIKDFLLSDYFRETMDLIFRVNRLTNEQGEAVELETILFLLKLSNYEKIEDAVQAECSIENTSTAKQVTQDLGSYIFEKTRKIEESLNVLEENKTMILPVTENIKEETNDSISINSEVKNEEKTETKEDIINKGFNMLGSNKIIKEARDIIKDEPIITSSPLLKDLTNKMSVPVETVVPVLKTPEPLGDVYLERISEDEKVIKKETIVTNKN